MILGAEIAMIVMGLIGLAAGWFPVAKGRVVRGIPARFLGLMGLLPVPVTLALCYFIGFFSGVIGMPLPRETWEPIAWIIELVVVLGFAILVSVLAYRWSRPDGVPASGHLGDHDLDLPAEAKPPAWEEIDAAPESSGMARASLMLGVFSLGTSLLASIPAFILGGLALGEIKRSGGRIAGRGAAIAGLILALIGTFTGFIVLALVIPLIRKAADPGPEAATPPIAAAAAAPAPAPTVANAGVKASVPKAPVRAKSARANSGFDRADRPATAVGIVTRPVATGASLASKPRKVGDLKVTDLKVKPAIVPACLAWGDGGKAVFVLETDGTLRRVALDGFREELKWEVKQKCSWLSMSAEGLVLTVDGLQEVWTLDPGTFAIKARASAASVTRAASSPALSIAFATGKGGEAMAVIDLKAGRVVREYDARSFPGQNVGYARLAVAPDGKSVFAEGMERLIRFALDGDELIFDEQSDRIAQNGKAIEISPDGAYVALPSGGGNYGAPAYTTNVYRTRDLSRPEIRVTSGAYPQALGFDLKAGFLYAQNSDDSLILFEPGGTKAKAYRLAARKADSSPRQFLVHPDGGKLFALSDTALSYVELPPRGAEGK